MTEAVCTRECKFFLFVTKIVIYSPITPNGFQNILELQKTNPDEYLISWILLLRPHQKQIMCLWIFFFELNIFLLFMEILYKLDIYARGWINQYMTIFQYHSHEPCFGCLSFFSKLFFSQRSYFFSTNVKSKQIQQLQYLHRSKCLAIGKI